MCVAVFADLISGTNVARSWVAANVLRGCAGPGTELPGIIVVDNLAPSEGSSAVHWLLGIVYPLIHASDSATHSRPDFAKRRFRSPHLHS